MKKLVFFNIFNRKLLRKFICMFYESNIFIRENVTRLISLTFHELVH